MCVFFVSRLVSKHEIHKGAAEYLEYKLVPSYIEKLLFWEDLEIANLLKIKRIKTN